MDKAFYGKLLANFKLDFLQKLMDLDVEAKPLKELSRQTIASAMFSRHTFS